MSRKNRRKDQQLNQGEPFEPVRRDVNDHLPDDSLPHDHMPDNEMNNSMPDQKDEFEYVSPKGPIEPAPKAEADSADASPQLNEKSETTKMVKPSLFASFPPVVSREVSDALSEISPSDIVSSTLPKIDSPNEELIIKVHDISGDANNSDTESHPVKPWPNHVGPRRPGYQAVIRRSVMNAINRHGKSTTEVEVCGVLIGTVYADDNGPYLYIDASIKGEKAGHNATNVTFTAETWQHIQGVMDSDFPDRKMVGWYHTHPGFGIFLSDMDLFIHRNFFNIPTQVAIVFDPISNEWGLFVWDGDKTERIALSIEEDVEKEEIVNTPVSPELTAEAIADFTRRIQSIERRQRQIPFWIGALLLTAIAWPVIFFTIKNDSQRTPRRSIPQAAETDPKPGDAAILTNTKPEQPTTKPAVSPAKTPTTAPAGVTRKKTTPATNPTATARK